MTADNIADIKDVLKKYRDDCINVGLNTDRCDRDIVYEKIDDVYKVFGETPPKNKWFFDSPFQAVIAIAMMQDDETLCETGVGDDPLAHPKMQDLDYRKKIHKDAYKHFSDVLFCANDIGWIGVFEYYKDVEKIAELQDKQGIIDFGKNVGWAWAYDTVAIFSERPVHMKFDEKNQFHSMDDLAIKYADGFGIAFYHGSLIPNDWVAGKMPSAQEILLIENTELRRIACEMVGWINILNECKYEVIDKHENPMIGELVEVELDMPDLDETERLAKFLIVKCGTGRQFALSVPFEMQSAKGANAWTYGMEESEFPDNFVRT